MGYNLSFWKYKSGTALNHQEVCEKLSDGKYVSGLEKLSVSQYRKRVADVFSTDGWKQFHEDGWENGKKKFQIYTTPQFFRVDCYSMEGEDMNKLIDIASEFECSLYDPQVGERYDCSSS